MVSRIQSRYLDSDIVVVVVFPAVEFGFGRVRLFSLVVSEVTL